MENSKGQTIFLSVIGIATLLVAIIGATFAYFAVGISGNESAQSVYVETMKLGSVTYTDNDAISLTNVKPITAAQLTDSNRKEFSIAQTDSAATETLSYTIKLEITEAGLATHDDGHFKHSLAGTKNGTGTLVSVELSEVPTSTTTLGTGTLVGYETHNYTYTIYLEEAGVSQAGQGYSFSGKIKVDLVQTQF